MTHAPQHNYGSVSLARIRFQAAEVGTPRWWSLLGRYHALSGKATPQRGSTNPAAVAWAREVAKRRPDGGAAGYLNRTHRKALRQAAAVATVAV